MTESRPAESSSDAFTKAFAAVAPLIREEWPDLDAEALTATEGDFDKVTWLVADHTDHTRVVVRRKLLELLTHASGGDKRAVNGAATLREKAKPPIDRMDDVIAAVRRLEAFASEEAKRVSAKMLPAAETKVRQNLWVSLLFALGLGVILGLWMNGGRRGR